MKTYSADTSRAAAEVCLTATNERDFYALHAKPLINYFVVNIGADNYDRVAATEKWADLVDVARRYCPNVALSACAGGKELLARLLEIKYRDEVFYNSNELASYEADQEINNKFEF